MVTSGTLDGLLVRYLAKRVLMAVVWVSVVLLGVYTLIELIREVRDLGGHYGWQAMLGYVAQTSPRRLYDIFPFAALIGTLIGVGSLAQHNELIAMRAAGVHRQQISAYALATIGVCLVILVATSELAVPGLERGAQASRDQARIGQIHLDRHGALWVRDGRYMIQIGHSLWEDTAQLAYMNVLVYELSADLEPTMTLSAQRAEHQSGSWRLYEVTEHRWLGDELKTQTVDQRSLPSSLAPELFDAAVTRPRLLATRDLIEMRRFLGENALDAGPYNQALWERVFYPLNVLAMVLIGLPFALGGVFRQNPRGGLGLNMFSGIVLGLGFFVLSRLVQGLALVWPLPVALTSALPAVAIASLAFYLLSRR